MNFRPFPYVSFIYFSAEAGANIKPFFYSLNLLPIYFLFFLFPEKLSRITLQQNENGGVGGKRRLLEKVPHNTKANGSIAVGMERRCIKIVASIGTVKMLPL